jgi:signal transduction histidine kinase
MAFERHHLAWILVSTTTVACFAGATAYTQRRLARLDAVASTLETNAIPSLEYLGRAGVRLTRLNHLLTELSSKRRAGVQAEARQELDALEQEMMRYLALPPLPNERAHWQGLQVDVSRAVAASRAAFDDGDRDAVAATDRRQVAEDALDLAVGSVLATVNSDTSDAEQMARNVRIVRAGTLRTVIALDAGSALIAALAAFLAFRASRAHDVLLSRHASVLSARVAELDTFAGRVAHDILNPLGAIATALSLLDHSADATGHRYVERAMRAVSRVRQLVDDLLAFARSGGRPGPTDSSSVDAVLDSLRADLFDASSEQGIGFVSEVAGPLPVVCPAGVLTSVIQNLVRNAIKYMGAAPVKRITVTARPAGVVARLEVSDTGPGIPPALQATVFEPFVRGSHEGIAGSGLGLATVKRLVESYGGRVGLESAPGAGTTIWVELPLVSHET